MNFDLTSILGTQRAIAPTRTGPAAAARPMTGGPTFAEHLTAASAIPSSPPREVQDAIGVAADAYDQLAASGRHLHFGVDPSSGRLTTEVHDAEGNVLYTVSPSTVLDVAAGGDLD